MPIEKAGIRAIAPDGGAAWFGAAGGRLGFLPLTGNAARLEKIDTISSEFRSIAVTKEAVFILNAGSPATLFRLGKENDAKPRLVYFEAGKDVFYDSMRFFNDREGIAMGDPMNGCFSVLTTTDGGMNWTKASCSALPPTAEGEAAFAASNSCLVTRKRQVWMVSGGKKARIFHSPDKGRSWEVFDTPIVQGEAMTGIFSADFYDERTGFVAGGNYEMPSANSGNKAITTDGGKTWRLVGEGQGPGYVSCVQFVPGSKGKGLVTVGATGIHCSFDAGSSWTKLSDARDFYTLRFISPKMAYAAGKGAVARLRFD